MFILFCMGFSSPVVALGTVPRPHLGTVRYDKRCGKSKTMQAGRRAFVASQRSKLIGRLVDLVEYLVVYVLSYGDVCKINQDKLQLKYHEILPRTWKDPFHVARAKVEFLGHLKTNTRGCFEKISSLALLSKGQWLKVCMSTFTSHWNHVKSRWLYD